MASQAVTKVEMVKILKEAFAGFRKTTKDDMDMGFAGFRKTTKDDMDMGFAGFRKTTKDDMDMGFAGFREVVKEDVAELIKTEVPKILAVEVPKMLLDFHEKVEEPMTEEILTRLGKIEKRLDVVEGGLGGLKTELRNEIGRLERKLDQVTDHQAVKLDDHEERIDRLEAATI